MIIEKRLAALITAQKPASVYDPIRYVLGSGGKRVRAMLVLLSCEATGGTARQALDAAAAIEILHNFTLVHDDVMDSAEVRRGKPTVHRRWNEHVAILAGDELIAYAYRSLLRTKSSHIRRILETFTEAFVQVCEGQGLDKEFELQKKVQLNDYLLMITKKTGHIISAATEIGAIIGNGKTRHVEALRRFGKHLGRAFQIQDDLLDITGNEEEFGKTIGADLIERKKTFLLLKALEQTKGNDRRFLQSLTASNKITKVIIARVREIYRRAGVLDAAREEIVRNTRQAHHALGVLRPSHAREMLHWMSDRLLERSS